MTDYTIREGLPSVGAYQAIRAETGWDAFSDQVVWNALSGSQFGSVALENGDVIGFSRVTDDGAIAFYVEDLIVTKAHRGKVSARQFCRQSCKKSNV